MKNLVVKFLLVMFLLSPLFPSNFVNAGMFNDAMNLASGQGQSFSLVSDKTPINMVSKILGTVYGLLGIIFFCLIFYGGILWFTGEGNSNNKEKAVKILVQATLGFIITFLAAGITGYLWTISGKL